MLRNVLLRLHGPDRRRVMRAGLASVQRRSTFDMVLLIGMPDGARLLRVIGGLGYEAGSRDALLHGVIERG